MFDLDLSVFNFCPDAINDLGQLLYDEVIEADDIRDYINLYTGVVTKRAIGFLGEGSIVGVPHRGCAHDPQDFNIGSRQVTLDPHEWEILIGMCYRDLNDTAAVYARHKGVRITELQDTDYYAIFLHALTISIRKMIVRFAWFNDTAADHFANGGQYTDSIDLEYFQVNDGLWKRIFIGVDTTSPYYVEIPENAGADYAAQEFNEANITQLLDDMIKAAGRQLKASPNKVIYVTTDIAEAYRKYLQDPCCLQSARDAMISGQVPMRYRGWPIVEYVDWTLGIEEYHNDVTNGRYWRPNRALATVKNAMAMSVDAWDSFNIRRVWYEKKDRMVYTELMGMVDTVIVAPQGWVVAAY